MVPCLKLLIQETSATANPTFTRQPTMQEPHFVWKFREVGAGQVLQMTAQFRTKTSPLDVTQVAASFAGKGDLSSGAMAYIAKLDGDDLALFPVLEDLDGMKDNL